MYSRGAAKARMLYTANRVTQMPAKCEVCESDEPHTGLIVVGPNGARRIALCSGCQIKAKARDAEAWETIHEILRRS
jgi:hypothetical protein